MNKRIIVLATICIGIFMVGCGGTTSKSTKSNDKKEIVTTENESKEMSDRDIINAIYDKLPKEEKEQIVDVEKTKIEKVILSSDKGIGKVNEEDDITGIELYKIDYVTDDLILGDVTVYATIDDLTICGYGLRD